MPADRPRVLVTRSPRQASALADRLRELGAEPILIPTIETVDPNTFAPFDAALANLTEFHWLIFTSANAVEAFSHRSKVLKDAEGAGAFRPLNFAAKRKGALAPEGIGHPRIAAIGPATARALGETGLRADLIPPQAVAESLTEALLPYARQPDGSPTRFLLIRAEEAREHLPETLRAAGAEMTIAPAYRTVVPADAAERIQQLFATESVYAVTFTSSSTARNLFALLEMAGCTLPPNVVRASIGPITSATLAELGFPAHVEASEATVQSLAETLVKYLATREST